MSLCDITILTKKTTLLAVRLFDEIPPVFCDWGKWKVSFSTPACCSSNSMTSRLTSFQQSPKETGSFRRSTLFLASFWGHRSVVALIRRSIKGGRTAEDHGEVQPSRHLRGRIGPSIGRSEITISSKVLQSFFVQVV